MKNPVPFGRYLLEKRLAVGGMAEIFLAKLPGAAGFEKTLAIKRILPAWTQNPDFIRMLIDEAKIAVRLSHPNIVQVYELGLEDESYYIAMEYIDGLDLKKLLSTLHDLGQKLPLGLAVLIISEILRGLSHAHHKKDEEGHDLNIVHRDISPQNILITRDGHVKIADFGIARAASQRQETQTGTFKGKLAYMSPEQALQRSVDSRSDLFSVGLLFYEILTGQSLFRRHSDLETLDAVRACVIPPLAIDGPPDLEALLLQATAKTPDARYQRADQFLKALEDLSQAHSLHATAESLASFIKEIRTKSQTFDVSPDFTQAESHAHKGETKILVSQVAAVRRSKANLVLKGVSLLVLLLVLGWVGLDWFRTEEPIIKESVTQEPVPRESPIQKSAIQESLTLESPTQKSEAVLPRGLVSVQALPWGLVYLDGKSLGETPIANHSMTAGEHDLMVRYPPTNRKLTKKIALSPTSPVRCAVDFRKAQVLLDCRP